MSQKPDLVVIVGPTGAGKTALGVFLAGKFSGEIVSADSRQIYKELSIGTAKPEGHWKVIGGTRRYVSHGIVHHLVDEIDPTEEFALPDFKERATKAIYDIHARGESPFLVGGTGQYVYAVKENWHVPRVTPNKAFRSRMKKYPAKKLDKDLRKIDPEAANIAQLNKRRLIRALEIYNETGEKPSGKRGRGPQLFKTLTIGIPLPKNYEKKIRESVDVMISKGLIDEIKSLIKNYSWDLPAMQSIDYQEFREYIEGEESLSKAKEKAVRAHIGFAKRQMTWFRRDKDIEWIENKDETEGRVKQFLNNN